LKPFPLVQVKRYLGRVPRGTRGLKRLGLKLPPEIVGVASRAGRVD